MAFICPEDLIADRLGQYACHPASMMSRLDQAIAVWENLSDTVDLDYLDKQICRQAPGLSLEWLEQEALKARRHTP
ncbi:hypothetical protein [Caenispirillum salinarum]|uniref:hypothetical protein n=1 Tax=Caenispirillum salinarum TaxID=859058 RepID=UPI0012672F83|nr:hypothetical protein [Caenispirillum salinarum]